MNEKDLYNECMFKAVRSSGSGGQHVNKVSTKIELHFNVENSNVLTDIQKEKIYSSLSHKITKDNELIITAQDTRSQLKNKQIAFNKLLLVLKNTLVTTKKRKPTVTPKAVKLKRLKLKRSKSDIKKTRKKPDLNS